MGGHVEGERRRDTPGWLATGGSDLQVAWCCPGRSSMCSRCSSWFAHLWRLLPQVAARLRSRGADSHTADTLAAETLTVAWQKLDQVPTTLDEATAWLHGVARNLLSNHRTVSQREERRREAYAFDRRSAVSVEGTGTMGCPDDLLLLRDAWDCLSAADREVLLLEAFEGLGPQELAERLGCRPGTATTRLSRARAHLRSMLNE